MVPELTSACRPPNTGSFVLTLDCFNLKRAPARSPLTKKTGERSANPNCPLSDTLVTFVTERIFPNVQELPGIYQVKGLNSLKMSLKRLGFLVFRRGRQSLPTPLGPFRSALQLPFQWLRYRTLSATHPALPTRRSLRWLRAALIFLVPSVLLVTLIAIGGGSHPASPLHAPANSLHTNWQAALDVSAPVESRRTVFPYSVIPGGVRDAKELATTVSKDHVVADHYSSFKLSQAHTVRLDQPTAMYVSYRVGNHIYWTKNRMVIPAGETLISDGENLARVRCGNRLSKIAALPVSASEPPSEQLETPSFVPPMLAEMLPGEGSETLPGVAAALPIMPPGPASDGPGPSDGAIIPLIPPTIFPPAGNVVIPPPPPVATPEPAGLVLLIAGALFGVVVAFFRK